MELDYIKYLKLEKELVEAESKLGLSCDTELDQLDEISNYDLVVTYYRDLGLDPYKLRGFVGKQLRDKIKKSPSFHAWLRSHHYESVDTSPANTLIETLKSAKKSADKAKKIDVQFFGYPDKNDKNFTTSDTVKDETGTNFNYLTPN